MFWMKAPVLIPKMLITDSSTTTMIATRFWVLSPTSIFPRTMGPIGMRGTFQKCRIQFEEEMEGTKMPRNLPKATPTAAIVPVWITRNSVQPYKNPQSGPSASRR